MGNLIMGSLALAPEALGWVAASGRTRHLVDCVHMLSTCAAAAAAAPPLVVVGPLPDTVAASDVVGVLRGTDPRPRVVLVVDATRASSGQALTAGADHVVIEPLSAQQVA